MEEKSTGNNIIKLSYREKVPVSAMKEILQNCLQEKLVGMTYDGEKCNEAARNISDNAKDRLKSLGYDRYKYIVQVLIGEKRDQGMYFGNRCFWDSNTDNQASENFSNVLFDAAKKTILSNAFQLDPDEDEDISTSKELINHSLFKRNFIVDSSASEALGEDPNIFDYDANYEDFKKDDKSSEISNSKPEKLEAPKARYINNLMHSAKIREKEKERVYEKKLLKERLEEDKIYGDQPKFLTSAYKKKLMEQKKWEYEERLMEEVEKRTDVRNKGMEGFYSNLLTKNIALGSDVSKNALSSYTSGSFRQNSLVEQNSSGEPAQKNRPLIEKTDIQEFKSEVKNNETSLDSDSPKSTPLSSNSSQSANLSENLPKAGQNDNHEISVKKDSKEDAVALARKRYLERKRKLAQDSD